MSPETNAVGWAKPSVGFFVLPSGNLWSYCRSNVRLIVSTASCCCFFLVVVHGFSELFFFFFLNFLAPLVSMLIPKCNVFQSRQIMLSNRFFLCDWGRFRGCKPSSTKEPPLPLCMEASNCFLGKHWYLFFLHVSRRFVFLKRQRRRAEKFTHLFTYSSAFVEARMFIRAFFCLRRRLPRSHARAYLFKRCPFCVQTLLADSSVCFSSPPAARRSSVASSQLPTKIPMLPFPFPTGKAANDLVYSPARENIKSPSDRDLAWEDFFFCGGRRSCRCVCRRFAFRRAKKRRLALRRKRAAINLPLRGLNNLCQHSVKYESRRAEKRQSCGTEGVCVRVCVRWHGLYLLHKSARMCAFVCLKKKKTCSPLR